MKSTLFSLSLLLISAFGLKAQDNAGNANPNAAEITFTSDVIDYGTIEHNADGNHSL
jgi:hypothetical protein